jgi:hypothetical protein
LCSDAREDAAGPDDAVVDEEEWARAARVVRAKVKTRGSIPICSSARAQWFNVSPVVYTSSTITTRLRFLNTLLASSPNAKASSTLAARAALSRPL